MATQTANPDASVAATQPPALQEPAHQAQPAPGGGIQVIRRNGKVTHFDPGKITVAVTKAFLAVEGGSAAASGRIHDTVKALTDQVVGALTRRLPDNGTVHIEDIQDQVELSLMRSGEHKAARAYVLYRESQSQKRADEAAKRAEIEGIPEEHRVNVTLADGATRPLDIERLQALVNEACNGLDEVDAARILQDACRNLFDGVKENDVSQTLVMSARTLIDREPNYSQVAARLLLDILRREALGFLKLDTRVNTQAEMAERYGDYFKHYIKQGEELELLDTRLGQYDLDRLIAAIKPARDLRFTYLGLQTLYDRYFLHSENGTRFELPQAFFMRVAMGLAINEIDREARAIEFYDLLSRFDFMSSTPTLFNSGTLRPQLSSCYLTTVADDLDGIYSSIKDNALLSKFAGGLGNDWTRVRGLGAHIKGTNGKSQGVVPFLKVANDTAVAVNQCFAPDTLVHTADGVKPIKAVEPGDLVLGQRGIYREVTKRMAYNQTDPMVEIHAKHAVSPLRVTSGHPLWALQGIPMEQANKRSYRWLEQRKVAPQWVEAGRIKPGDYVAQAIPREIVPVAHFHTDEARLYGILLGDGHCTKQGLEWGVSGNPGKDAHLDFVRGYLEANGIHYWIKNERPNYLQIGWSAGYGVARDATTGQLIRGDKPGFLFSREDLYDAQDNKRIARRYAHLPEEQTLSLIQGLLETDGNISRAKEITFTNTSQPLIEGLRYQLLRLGIPSSGQYRERRQNHRGIRGDGESIRFNGVCKAYDLRIPAVKRIAERMGCKTLTKFNWLHWENWLFTRVRRVTDLDPVPFVYDLKVEGDHAYMTTAALAHNGGKRKGAVCAYLETWHVDIEEFLELRKNTGDERRRTHDMNTANWIPDLFMQRVAEEKDWTLFSPNETPDLHDLTGKAFEAAYVAYEAKAARGEMDVVKSVKAVELWRKMLGLLFETGHPWITFKDPCNLRYTNQHMGVVHSSNLCTEITLHTNDSEIAVCNLGSVNLTAHTTEQGLDLEKLERTVTTAMRMLDNVIDYNFYSVPQARQSNLRHRPVGLGIMGFQDALYKQRLPYTSDEALAFADRSMEAVSYFAIQASSDLAAERGRYSSYEGSLWSQGVLPIDSLKLLKAERGDYLQVDESQTLDWDALRDKIHSQGMRNANTMAIAPTATISNICGVSQSIEPTYQNLFVKSNLSGEFTVVNPYMVHDLKKLDLWDEVMINDLKYYDGSLQPIDRIPDALKSVYATAFEIDPRWLVEAGSRRQKWIDQGQSLNLYMAEPSGKKLDNLYKLAWVRGLKTTYYLRSIGATGAEKTSVKQGSDGGGTDLINANGNEAPKACSILDPDCDACQ
ncbi:MAG: ribonucleoside-diphosphate reductase subunit alpha [Candidatus Thiodiazotropha sp. (ex Epidulcina cf. delphinae)]|nr:ribonucleoside-diphosphate reductase subunit alpha [Candidatus Thiodiazotropha sp. (ex Epidulcina cf. delphinae)]